MPQNSSGNGQPPGAGLNDPSMSPPVRKISFHTMWEDWANVERVGERHSTTGHKRDSTKSNIEDGKRLRRVKTDASLGSKVFFEVG